MTIVACLSLLSHVSLLSAAEIVALKTSDIKPYSEAVEGFISTCNCTVTELNLQDMDRKDIKENILRLKPDAVLAIGTDALNRVLTLSGLPVFYTMASPPDPGSAGPGKNIFGVSMDIRPETYLITMARLLPDVKRIGLIYNRQNTGQFVKDALAVSRFTRFEIIALENSVPGRAPALIESLKGKIDVFWILPDSSVITSGTIETILLFSFQNHVPVVSYTKKHVKMGAVASLTVSPFDLGAQAGELAAIKLRNDLLEVPALSRPQKIALSVNKKIAEKLGVRLSDAALRDAGEVY